MILQIFFFCFTLLAHATATVEQQNAAILDALRSADAVVSGDIRVDRSIPLFSDNGIPPKRLTLVQNRPLSFSVDEHGLAVTSLNALVLNVAGIDLPITRINYDDRTGFHVDVDSPLWWNIGGAEVANEVKRELERKYSAKMQLAFQQVKRLRQQRNMRDANLLIDQIKSIFNEPNNAQAVNMNNVGITGSVSAAITSTRSRNFNLGEVQLQIRPGSSLTASTEFTLRGNNFRVQQVSFAVNDINVFPTNGSATGSVRVTGGRVSLSRDGLNMIFDTPAENEVMTVALAVTWLAGVARTGTLATGVICPPDSRVQFIQDMISARVRPQLAALIREHRQDFIRGGVEVAVLNALD